MALDGKYSHLEGFIAWLEAGRGRERERRKCHLLCGGNPWEKWLCANLSPVRAHGLSKEIQGNPWENPRKILEKIQGNPWENGFVLIWGVCVPMVCPKAVSLGNNGLDGSYIWDIMDWNGAQNGHFSTNETWSNPILQPLKVNFNNYSVIIDVFLQ